MVDIRGYAFHVALENGAREDIRGEVTVAALGAAERHRDINAQRHRD
jgi:hypothetical protein